MASYANLSTTDLQALHSLLTAWQKAFGASLRLPPEQRGAQNAKLDLLQKKIDAIKAKA